MGLRGPKSKPADEQIKRGDPGRRAKKQKAKDVATISGAPPAAIDVMEPVMPDYLVEEAIEHWKFIVPQLKQAGIIRAVDVDLLGEYCQCMGKAIKYERYCQEYGDFVQRTKSAASKVARPELKLIADLRERAGKLADKLGLTPKSRIAMGVNITPPVSAQQQAEDEEDARILQKRR